ncbi:MAG: RNA polymerase sigma factor, partial [Candidatus Zixiibacteriota bacterium]
MDDKTLVTDFLRAKGETEFRALYRRHTPALYQSVWRLARGIEAEALELTQATWVRALERLASFRWESSFRTWLIGVAYNCYREHVRDNRREVSVDCTTIDEFPGKSPEPFTSAESIDLERALCRLPDGYREVLLLHDLEGYTH